MKKFNLILLATFGFIQFINVCFSDELQFSDTSLVTDQLDIQSKNPPLLDPFTNQLIESAHIKEEEALKTGNFNQVSKNKLKEWKSQTRREKNQRAAEIKIENKKRIVDYKIILNQFSQNEKPHINDALTEIISIFEFPSGGIAKVGEGGPILQNLIDTYQNQNISTSEKILNYKNISGRAEEVRGEIQQLGHIPDFPQAFKDALAQLLKEEKIKQAVHDLLTDYFVLGRMRAKKLVGGTFFINVVVGLGCGGFTGLSEDSLGKKHLVVAPNVDGKALGFGTGVTLEIQDFSWNEKEDSRVVSLFGFETSCLGLGAIWSVDERSSPNTCTGSGITIGNLNPVLSIQQRFLRPYRVGSFKARRNYKMLRKRLKIQPALELVSTDTRDRSQKMKWDYSGRARF